MANPALFLYFRPFLITISIIQIEKSIDGVLGIQTRGRQIVGSDETTELWRSPQKTSYFLFDFKWYTKVHRSNYVKYCPQNCLHCQMDCIVFNILEALTLHIVTGWLQKMCTPLHQHDWPLAIMQSTNQSLFISSIGKIWEETVLN